MKKIILSLLLLNSFSSFALTVQEEIDFRDVIEEKSLVNKIGLAGLNIISMVAVCPTGITLTSLALTLDSIPVLAMIPDAVHESLDGDQAGNREESYFYTVGQLLGGAKSALVDMVMTPMDMLDGDISDGRYTMAFENMRSAYASTEETAMFAFGESGMCTDQYEKLGIILGLK